MIPNTTIPPKWLDMAQLEEELKPIIENDEIIKSHLAAIEEYEATEGKRIDQAREEVAKIRERITKMKAAIRRINMRVYQLSLTRCRLASRLNVQQGPIRWRIGKISARQKALRDKLTREYINQHDIEGFKQRQKEIDENHEKRQGDLSGASSGGGGQATGDQPQDQQPGSSQGNRQAEQSPGA